MFYSILAVLFLIKLFKKFIWHISIVFYKVGCLYARLAAAWISDTCGSLWNQRSRVWFRSCQFYEMLPTARHPCKLPFSKAQRRGDGSTTRYTRGVMQRVYKNWVTEQILTVNTKSSTQIQNYDILFKDKACLGKFRGLFMQSNFDFSYNANKQ